MIGTILLNRYRLDAELGRGGMGIVYRAHDTLLERDVAVKVLSQAGLGSEGRARLLREAQSAARLNHPHIVGVYDAGEADGVPFIVMELVEGESLFEHRPQMLDEILSVAKQICAALDHAHAHGIVHRDLKLENVIVAPDGTAKLMDFGLARSVASRLTAAGALVGTVFYLAPEQALGQEVDGRADLYALGVMLYEMATGRLPFVADDPFAVISQHLHAPVVPPRAHNEEIPPAFDALIVRLLSKRPEDRPGTAQEVIQALDQVASTQAQGVVGDEMSLLDRIVRGRLVGRERELAEANSLWQRAASGMGQVLLISGEPGIGKTRLVRELVTRVEVSGGRALLGECYAEGGAPYAPIAQAIRDALADADSMALPPSVIADLIALAPDLRARFPDVPPNPPLDPEAEQQRLLENAVALANALADRAPLLLILEDAHWADGGTLSLLRHVARRTRARRLLIVMTYREVELDEARALNVVLHDLNRERLATRIKLSRLSREQTRDLLGMIFAEEIAPDFLEGMYRETEGNPFFVEEVCKALIESGKLYFADGRWHRPSMDELEIPQSVRVAIQSRVRKLAEPAQTTLQLAAVFGREFDYGVLAQASDLDEDALIAALESAERAQLIAELTGARDVSFVFAHALIPATLYEGVSALRRRRLHRRVAQAIETLHPDDFEALAHHFVVAGERSKAVDYSHRAARRAQTVHAYDTAKRHLTTALDLMGTEERSDTRLAVLEELGDVLRQLGQHGEAIPAYHEALEVWQDWPNASRMIAVRLHRKVVDLAARVQFADLQRSEATFRASAESGLKLAEGEPPHPEIVRLLATLSYDAWLTRHPKDWDSAERYARAAVDVAERLDAPVELSVALDALSSVYGARGMFRERVPISLRRLALSHDPRFTEVHERASIQADTGRAFVHVGEYDKALPYLLEAKSLARQIQALGLQALALTYQAGCWFQLDRWDSVIEVEAELRAMENLYPNFLNRAGAPCFLIALSASVSALRGEFDRASLLRDEALTIMTDAAGPPERWDRSNRY